jgi:hypothetical protein
MKSKSPNNELDLVAIKTPTKSVCMSKRQN